MWLGLVARANEVYIHWTPEGVVRSWTARRTGGHERRGQEDVLAVEGERAHGEPPPIPAVAPPITQSLCEDERHHDAWMLSRTQGAQCNRKGTSRTGTPHTHAGRAAWSCSGQTRTYVGEMEEHRDFKIARCMEQQGQE